MGVRAPGGGAPGVQVMAGECGTAGSPAWANEMIDVKKARVLYRVRHLARLRKIRVTRPLAADWQRSRVVPWQSAVGEIFACVRPIGRRA